MKKKKQKLNLVLNEIKESSDPTIIPCTFIIMDFDISHNNVIVTQEVALEGAKSLINKPIVAKYNDVEEANTPTDNFGSHEQVLDEDRYGNEVVKTETTPIGVFTTEGYTTTININGEDKEVLAADAVLWYSRFTDACDLIVEWYNRGIKINTSCEYLYSNYSFQDGIEYHHSPLYFEGHALLASEDRGIHSTVTPAYDSATLLSFNEVNKFYKLVAQANQQLQKEEIEEMKFFKKVNELSHGDIRSLLYNQLDASIGQSTYSWISDVYDNYFIANIYSYEEGNEFDKNYKYTYTNENDVVSVDLDSKTEVMVKRDWVEVSQFLEIQNELDQVKTQLNEKVNTISKLETQINSVTTEKSNLETKFNDTSEKLIQLNTKVEELEPIKAKYEEEVLEKAINEQKSFFSAKFVALNAADKFEADDVQTLVKLSAKNTDEGKNAILQLNSMLVELVTVGTKEEIPAIREIASKRENLLPPSDDFESRYSS